MAAPQAMTGRARWRGLGSHDLPSGSGDVDELEAWLIDMTDPADTVGNPVSLTVYWSGW